MRWPLPSLRPTPTPQQIAKRAKGPAARELAWEGWQAAEYHWTGIDRAKSRTDFERWWKGR